MTADDAVSALHAIFNFADLSDTDRHEAIGRGFDRLEAANFEGRDHTALLDLCHDVIISKLGHGVGAQITGHHV